MLNKIIQYSLHNRLLVMIAAVALLIWGSITAHNMEVDVFPDLNAPTVVVMTEAQGMAPEEVERLVTFPVETAVNGATDVRRVRSSSTTGFSVVWVEFEWGTNIYTARQIVSEKLATLGEALPDNVGTPTLGPQSSILGEMMIIGLTADSTSLQDLRTIADWTIRPRLLSTGGVAQVAVIGGDIKEYQILLDPARMKYYNIGLDEVLPVVENMNQNATGGILYEYGNEYIIQGVMATTRVEEIGKAVIKTVDDFPITLADIANVQIGAKTPKLGVASEKGKPAVLVTVTKQPGTNTLELTDKLDASIQELRKTLPEDVEVSTDIFRQSRFINSSIHNIQEALLEGAVFVIVVLFFFLMNFRTTIISLVALPLSMLMAILVMHALGLTINTMSLGGLAIAIGSLVDDAIVVMENIYTKIEQGMSPLEAGFKGSNEIFFAVIATTIALVAVFFPIVFLQGTTGRLFREFSIVITGAVIISSFVALTFTPMISTKLLTRNVTRVVPQYSDDPAVQMYYEFMHFYPVMQNYLLTFTKPGSYARLQKILGKAPDEKWTGEDRTEVLSLYNWVKKAFLAHGGARLQCTVGDVLLLLLRVYTKEELANLSPSELSEKLDALWDDVHPLRTARRSPCGEREADRCRREHCPTLRYVHPRYCLVPPVYQL